MATSTKNTSLTVSAYDRAAGWVVSLNILIGFGVALLFLIWLSRTLVFHSDQSHIALVENVLGRGDHAAGYERDIEPPGIEELEEETEPVVRGDIGEMDNTVFINVTINVSTERLDSGNQLKKKQQPQKYHILCYWRDNG